MNYSTCKVLARVCVYFITLCITQLSVSAQISEIFTDFNGFWKSGRPIINTVRPDNSHNLLAFKYRDTIYSTGVNNQLLTSNNVSFIAGDYRALPVTSVPAPTSGTYIGLGQLYDGVDNGPSNPAPVNNIPFYLTDGPKGLNLGTAVYNLPISSIKFDVSNFQVPKIGDSIPDIIVTQMGETVNTSLDTLFFSDANGVLVGNPIVVRFIGIDTIALGTFDFYTANTDPMTIASGNSFTKSPRALRFYATDLSAFGLNGTNVNTVKYFTQKLSGTSDIAFTAYNTEAIKILPLNNPGAFSTLPGLWIKANDGTSTINNSTKTAQWQDRSPNAFSLEQSSASLQPQFKNGTNSGFNFNPYLNFDNANRLVSINSPFLSENGNADFFIVGRPTNTTATNKIIGFSRSAADNLNTNQGDFPALGYSSSGASVIDNANYSNPLTGNTTNLNRSYIWHTRYENGATINVFNNGVIDGAGGVAVGMGKHSFQMGDASPGDNGSDFDVAELIVFPVNLTDSERVKVETYLALKYGLPLNHNYVSGASVATWDLAANTGYNNNIFGIGREDGQGLYQKQSKSEAPGGMITTGIGSIATENSTNFNTLNNLTYSLVGDNGDALNWQSTEKPAKLDFRIGREWKVKETGTVGTLFLQVPASASTEIAKLPEPNTCKMFMLVDNDGDFSSGIIAQVELTLNGTNWEGSYNFADGNYFTFATENKDYGDLPTTWPSASANINGCDVNKDGLYNRSDNNEAKLLVWAGTSVTSELVANTTNSDAADDGLQTASSFLVPDAGNQFNVLLNSNIANTPVYYRLWFDWNNDGNFANDNGLDVATLSIIPATYAGSAVVNASGSATASINVRPPVSFSLQYKTRLVVSDAPIPDMYRNNNSTYQYALSNGEVEDYSAIILLPVTLKSFSVTSQECTSIIQWETATEINSNAFSIEQSLDGIHFATIGNVTAKNLSNGSSYRFYINQFPQGTNYFRLKLVDRDGKLAYSKVISAILNCHKTVVSMSPNPVKNNLHISGLTKKAQLVITDDTGRPLLSQNTGDAVSINLNISSWVPGVYNLHILTEGKAVEIHQFLKQ